MMKLAVETINNIVQQESAPALGSERVSATDWLTFLAWIMAAAAGIKVNPRPQECGIQDLVMRNCNARVLKKDWSELYRIHQSYPNKVPIQENTIREQKVN